MNTIRIRMACLALAAALALSAEGFAAQAKLDVGVSEPVLLAGGKRITYLKAGLTGFSEAERKTRAPVNVALVIDRSGSMSGAKLENAKTAAIQAVERLGPDDILAVVAYDTTVNVLVPATKVTDKDSIAWAIRRLEAGSNTALFAGVSRGADEVRKFLAPNRVNRVILLSDGLANVGPSTPGELGDFGASLAKEGVSVTTLGLGLDYNEDLMARLAGRSDGTHAFVREPEELSAIFEKEFRDALTVVARDIRISIECAPGVRPVRTLGREASIDGQVVTATMSQVCAGQEKYVMVEVEIDAGQAGASRDVAKATATYLNLSTKTTDTLTSAVAVRYSDAEAAVASARNKDVAVEAVRQVANDNNKRALELRDQGLIAEATNVLNVNINYLNTNAAALGNDPLLLKEAAANSIDVSKITTDGTTWDYQRKEMRAKQAANENQQNFWK